MAKRLLIVGLIVLISLLCAWCESVGAAAKTAEQVIAEGNAKKYESDLGRVGLENDAENRKREREARREHETVKGLLNKGPHSTLKRRDAVEGKLDLGEEMARRLEESANAADGGDVDAEVQARREEAEKKREKIRAEREEKLKERNKDRKEEIRNRMREDRRSRGRDFDPDNREDIDAMMDRHRERHRERHARDRHRGRGRGREKRKTAREVRHENIRNRIEKFQHHFTPEEHAEMDEDLKDHWEEEKKLDDERDRVNAQWEAVRDIDDRDERLDRLAYLKEQREKNRDAERLARDAAREKFTKIRERVDQRISSKEDLR